MPHLLHIITKTGDALSTEVISKQREKAEDKIEVFDLTKAEPDYKALLEKIFAADSVQVW